MKNFSILILISMCSFLLTIKISADSTDVKIMNDPSSFIKKTMEISKTTTTIESDFTQKKHLSFFSEDVNSNGKFYYKKENLLRWEYVSPFKYIMVMNKDKLYINDDVKTTMFDVNSNKMFSEINDIMISCLNGTILTDNKKFKTSFFEDKATYLVKLSPLSDKMKEYLKQIEILFNKNDLSLSQLKLIELSGDFTTITFRNKKMNHIIPNEKFIIK